MAATTPKTTEESIIEQFEQATEPILTAVEIADSIGMTRQGVNQQLKKLEERGVVQRKKVGGRAVAWWLSD